MEPRIDKCDRPEKAAIVATKSAELYPRTSSSLDSEDPHTILVDLCYEQQNLVHVEGEELPTRSHTFIL